MARRVSPSRSTRTRRARAAPGDAAEAIALRQALCPGVRPRPSPGQALDEEALRWRRDAWGEEPAMELRRPASERLSNPCNRVSAKRRRRRPAGRAMPAISRTPGPLTAPGTSTSLPASPPASRAVFRVPGLDIPWAWVGPPTTTRSGARGECAPAEATGTTETSVIGQPPATALGLLLGAPEHRFVEDHARMDSTSCSHAPSTGSAQLRTQGRAKHPRPLLNHLWLLA